MPPTSPPESPSPAPGAALPQAWRVEVFRREAFEDPEGKSALAAIGELGIDSVERVRLGRGYLLPPTLTPERVRHITRGLLADPVLDEARLVAPGQAPAPPDSVPRHRVLVARKPGVMDPVAQTLGRALVKNGLVEAGAPPVGTFQAWEIEGPIGPDELATLARRTLANEVIEDLSIGEEGLAYGTPSPGARREAACVPLRELDEGQLAELSRRGGLSLDVEEMGAIQAHFRGLERDPTPAELETLAQTWSEHCRHKTFRGLIEMDGRVIDDLLASTIARATAELHRPWCVSVFHDNAGIVEFEPDLDAGGGRRGWDLAIKVETHNHPSAIDPYGGAGTGIGGVIRDVLGVGLGAKPIANIDAFFVGPSDLPAERVPAGAMHPRRILRGVVAGVRDYGNRMGIPTVAGGVWFDEGYVANPLVYAGTLGLIPRSCATKEVRPGDVILLVGGRTGRDGIHGATFSSVELSETSETVSASAVQIGDPITEKKLTDALLVARDAGLYRAITDCGAGGLSSAVGEMGEDCGAEVHLERVPLKYPGLAPEEIWISEAQERMVLAVPPETLEAAVAVFAAEDVEATAIGSFTGTGRLVLLHDGERVGELDMAFLHGGAPRPTRRATWSPPDLADPGAPPLEPPGEVLEALLARPNVASKEWIVRQYDHEVQGMSVVKPMAGPAMDGPSDGVVLRPLAASRRGVALGCGAHPRSGLLDPAAMALGAIDEALRNVVACGGDPTRTALLDNFSWGNCAKPDRLGALVLAAEACYRAAMAYGTPFISGKDSLNNEYRLGDETLSIPPTLFVSALSIVPDVGCAVTMDAKAAGDRLWLVGTTRGELGASELHAHLGLEGGRVPRPDLASAPGLLARLHRALAAGRVRACHDLSEGGLAVALAETCMAGGLGADVHLGGIPLETLPTGYDPTTTRLFSESTTRFLVEVAPGEEQAFLAALDGAPATPIGTLTDGARIRITPGEDALPPPTSDAAPPLIDLPLTRIRAAFQGAFQG